MRPKSVVAEARQIRLASDLIRLGARLQVLEAETTLSRERLLRLYKELCGKSPPKGMLPFSTDWFMTWQPNVHSSLFMNIFHSVNSASALEPAEALVAAFRLYQEQVALLGQPAVLSLTRAWRLLKFFECGMLAMARCTRCTGRFVVHAHDPVRRYVCGLCHMPARAGRGARAAAH
ncbi:MAG: flagellar transcriptional regulator FlhC [Burkholderiales bacterium]|nr:flagellar transcriptional regulator FlhC [Burkholderiales bacterium]